MTLPPSPYCPQDNLEACCLVFERAATEKAVRDVDNMLKTSYEDRAKARAVGKPFADSSAFHGCALNWEQEAAFTFLVDH